MDEGQAGAASPDAGPAPTKPMIVFTPAVLAEHCTAESCWLAIEGGVYDVTGYLGSHPGGAGVILAAAGTDATAQFSAFHRRAVLSEVAAQFRIGTMAGETRTAVTVDTAPEADAGDTEGYVEDRISAVMDGSKGAGFGSHTVTRCTAAELRALQNVSQIGAEAVRRGPPALVSGYVNYGSEDEESIRNNRAGYSRYRLRPRVLRDVRTVNTTTTILGGRITLAFPVVIAPFAAGRAMHPEGELCAAAAATTAGIAYTVPHYGGYPLPQVAAAAAAAGEANLMIQLYVPKLVTSDGGDGGADRMYLRAAIAHAASQGVKAVVITVDTINNGNRERTYKHPAWIAAMVEECGGFPEVRTLEEAKVGPLTGHTQRLSWDDIAWVKAECRAAGDMAVLVKGIMTAEDTALAAACEVDGVIVSNHGGRQLDGTDGTIEVLAECVEAAAGRCDVFMDGGIRRGKDVYKALALGAAAVFVGRPVLWGMLVGGGEGVGRTLEILREELVTVMQLMGTTQIDSIDAASVRDREARH